MMTFELPLILTGDPEPDKPAGYCAGCGEYVTALHHCDLRLCVVCGRTAQKFDVGAGPWCSDLCQTRGRCDVCGLPPADYEGHWCATGAGMVWRRWEQ